MKSFQEWREGGKINSDDAIVKKLAQKFADLETLEKDVHDLIDQLSRDPGPIHMALDKFRFSKDLLKSTLRTAIIKDRENPERADHGPVSTPE